MFESVRAASSDSRTHTGIHEDTGTQQCVRVYIHTHIYIYNMCVYIYVHLYLYVRPRHIDMYLHTQEQRN